MTPRRIEDVVGRVGSGSAVADGFVQNTLAIHGAEPLSAVKLLLSPVFDLVGVRYVVLGPEAPSPRPGLTLIHSDVDARVYRNDAAFPRAFLVSQARCTDDASALRDIWSGRMQFREEVLLADCTAPFRPVSERGTGRVVIDAYGAAEVRLTAATSDGAYLVLTDTWYPGWRANVDGADSRVWRANHAFRAVWVPPGTHAIVFHYEPRSFMIGLTMTALALCVAISMLFLRGERRRAA